MNLKNTFKTIAIAASSTGAGSVLAHEGHGLFGSHWHATDVLGFIGVAVALAVAVWLSRDGK